MHRRHHGRCFLARSGNFTLSALLRGLVLLLSVGVVSTAWAYDYQKQNGKPLVWPANQSIGWYLNTSAYTKIPAKDIETAFRDAFKAWSSIRCANLRFVYRGPTTAGASGRKPDNKNVIVFSPQVSFLFTSGSIYDPKTGKLRDMDVQLSTQTAWSLNPNGNEYDLRSVAMMVVGRLIGLLDSKVKGATMYQTVMADDISARTLDKDDIAGACFLYPSGKKEQCLQDSDCPPGGLGCNAQKQCVPKAVSPSPKICQSCKTTADCGQGLVCDFITSGRFCVHLCSPDGLCPKNYSCNGAGVNAQCIPDAGLCPGSQCKSDSDCQQGQKCTAGLCGPACSSNQDCQAPTPICQAGKCVASGGSGCASDSDCAKGEVCFNKKCLVCIPSRSENCTCSDGKAGVRICDGKGAAWSICQCQGGGGNICQPGATQACSCAGGKTGSQTCNGDGKAWGQCQCQGGGGNVCAPGATQSCLCAGGKRGSQSCNSDGKGWSPCQCQGGGYVCTPGATQQCVCPGSKQGSQSCNSNGQSWGKCQCQGGGNVCQPGATQQCACTNGQLGSQSCADGTRWSDCQCSGSNNQGDAGAGADVPPQQIPCQSHASCPADHICVKEICRKKAAGCSCTLASDDTMPPAMLWFCLLGLFLIRRRRTFP